MKKIFISLIVMLFTMVSLAQTQLKKIENAQNENAQNNQSYDAIAYRLFPTPNIWTFIKLNTRNGQMWQVQYSMKKENRFESILNLTPLVAYEEERNNRFALYPTQNIYNFILLDQLDGRVWQVQWSSEPESRVIIPIK